MIDSTVPGSPGWWFQRLGDKQLARLPRLHRLARYAEGCADLPEGDDRVRETFIKFQRKARSNYTGLVVESVLERLRVTGFRAGDGSTQQDDTDAWAMWQANSMDADFGLGLRAALAMSEAYVMVGPPDGSAGPFPVISVEDPREVIAEMDPLRKRRALAALKVWDDSVYGVRRAILLLPDRIYSYVSPMPTDAIAPFDTFAIDSWEPAGDAPNVVGRVPVVRLPNRMGIDGSCMGEAEDVLDIQDRINSQILDRLVISKMQAYRQRWITGAVFEDEEGNPTEPFKPGADLVWAVEDTDAKFGDFSQADLTPILSAVKDDIKDMAAISRTPPHYLLSDFINASGDAFAQSETGHVAKCFDRMLHYGEAAEDVLRLCYAYRGDARASSFTTEVVWGDPQYRSLSERADAAVKMVAAGVPWRTVVTTVLGYSPQEANRMETERSSDALLSSLTAPAPPVPPGQTPERE